MKKAVKKIKLLCHLAGGSQWRERERWDGLPPRRPWGTSGDIFGCRKRREGAAGI